MRPIATPILERLLKMTSATENLAFRKLGIATRDAPAPYAMTYLRHSVDMIDLKILGRSTPPAWTIGGEPFAPEPNVPQALVFTLFCFIGIRHKSVALAQGIEPWSSA